MRLLMLGLLVLLLGCGTVPPPDGACDLQLSEAEQRFASALGLYGRALVAEAEAGSAADDAFLALRHAAELDPSRMRVQRKLANVALRRRDPQSAIAALETLRKHHPESAQTHFELASIHQALGQMDLAVELYRESIRIAPEQVHGYWQCAQIFFEQKRDDDAFSMLGSGLRDSGNPEALTSYLTLLGAHWAREKQTTRATAAFAFLADHYEPGRSGFLQILAQLHEQHGDVESALSTLEMAVQADPRSSTPITRLAALQLRQIPATGIETLLRGIDRFPKNVEMLFMLAYAYLRTQHYAEAADVFKKIRGIVAEESDAALTQDFYILYASACDELGRDADVEQLLLECLEKYPDAFEAMNFLAYTWALQGRRLNEALSLIERALQAEPDNGAYIDTRGWVYYRQQRYEEALADLLRAGELVQDDATILDHIGDAYQALGQTDKAVEYWLKSLAAAPGNAEIETKLREKGIPEDQLPSPLPGSELPSGTESQ
jgi:tetratricopeptide (TPR) repeat protein